MLDTATDYRGWKRYDLDEEHRPFMEVFDPDVGTWEPLLPNPLFMGFSCHEMVLLHRDPYNADTYNGFYKSSYTISFYVYNVMDRP